MTVGPSSIDGVGGYEIGIASEGLEDFLLNLAIFLPVAVASYRRSRHLSGYSVTKSLVIAYGAGSFWMLWFVVWWVNREQIAREWREVRDERARPRVAVAG